MENIKKVAKLAAIKLNQEEEKIYKIGSVFNLLNTLQKVNTEGIEPLRNVHDATITMRQDIAAKPQEDVLQSAKHVKYDYFATPKFVE